MQFLNVALANRSGHQLSAEGFVVPFYVPLAYVMPVLSLLPHTQRPSRQKMFPIGYILQSVSTNLCCMPFCNPSDQ